MFPTTDFIPFFFTLSLSRYGNWRSSSHLAITGKNHEENAKTSQSEDPSDVMEPLEECHGHGPLTSCTGVNGSLFVQATVNWLLTSMRENVNPTETNLPQKRASPKALPGERHCSTLHATHEAARTSALSSLSLSPQSSVSVRSALAHGFHPSPLCHHLSLNNHPGLCCFTPLHLSIQRHCLPFCATMHTQGGILSCLHCSSLVFAQ